MFSGGLGLLSLSLFAQDFSAGLVVLHRIRQMYFEVQVVLVALGAVHDLVGPSRSRCRLAATAIFLMTSRLFMTDVSAGLDATVKGGLDSS
ncbi:hypothetical protein CFP75_18605 [Amycolatopsis alba DSM 44262]|uniref:Uncharacterized protein n=1 Tax=Amycolatopsis alba DSM 44262 TaxID=1125972 RepID=A0A229RSU3_AMYAL|nr:hypothetical protein CFP75_18605 [Amycolatopsis alba DSM 44262]